MSNTKIYVGNLSYDTTQDDLFDYFSQYGTVKEAKLVTDQESRRSKGFGFITFETVDEAQSAIDKANNVEYMGRRLRVNSANSKGRPNQNQRRPSYRRDDSQY